jgi:hypothetical protein
MHDPIDDATKGKAKDDTQGQSRWQDEPPKAIRAPCTTLTRRKAVVL